MKTSSIKLLTVIFLVLCGCLYSPAADYTLWVNDNTSQSSQNGITWDSNSRQKIWYSADWNWADFYYPYNEERECRLYIGYASDGSGSLRLFVNNSQLGSPSYSNSGWGNIQETSPLTVTLSSTSDKISICGNNSISVDVYYVRIEWDDHNLFVIGEVDSHSWNPTVGTSMDYNSSDNSYTKLVTINGYFAFSTVLAENNDQGGWDYVNSHRYGASSANQNPLIGPNSWNSLTSGENNYYFSNSSDRNKTYFVTVDWTNSRFSLAPLYAVSFSAGANGSVSAEWNGNAISTNDNVPSGQTVSFTATPSSGYSVADWTVNGTPQGSTSNTLDVVVSAATTVTVSFEVKMCEDTKTIRCVDYDNSTIPSGSGNSTPSNIAPNSDYYDITGDFIDFKGSNGEIFFPVTLPAATYSFTIYHVNGNNKWFNLYDASGNKIHYYGELGDNWGGSVVSRTTDSWALSAGNYYIGLYGEGWVGFEKIVINANSDVFCITNYALTLNRNNTSYGTVASDQADNSAIAGGTTVTVTATPNSGYRFDHWEDGSSATITYKAEYAFTLNANTSLTAVFVADDYCRSVNTIEVEDAYLASGAVTGGKGFPSELTLYSQSGSGNDYDGTCHGGYVGFRGSSDCELFFAVDIPEAGDYQFYASAGQDKNMYINVYTTTGNSDQISYAGTDYRKVAYRRINESYGTEAFKYTEATSTLSLSAGTVIVGLYAGWSYACFDQLMVERVDGKSVFCPPAICTDETINATDYAFCLWNNKLAEQTSGQISVSGTTVQFDYSNNDTGAEWFYPVTLANAEYNFTITHTNDGSNQTFRIYKEDANGTIYYSGKRYLQVGTDHSLTADGSGKSYCNYIDLATGNYLLSLYCLRNTRFTSIQIESTTCNAVNTDTYSLTLSSGGNGTAISDQINNAKVLSGTSVTLLATPNSGYRFVRWSDSNTDNPRTLTLTANTTLNAVFEAVPTAECANTYTIDCTAPITPTSATVAAATTTEVTGGHIINKDANRQLYYLLHIPDNGTYKFTVVGANRDKDQTLNIYSTDGALSGTVTYSNTTYTKKATYSVNTANSGENRFYPVVATTSLTLTEGDYIVGLQSANSWSQFERIVVGGTFCNYHNLTLSATNGTATTAGKKQVGTTVTITATPSSGYAFTGWTVDAGGAVLDDATEATTTFTMPDADVTITANFSRLYTLTLASNPAGGGTLTGSGSYVEGQQVEISAVANSGYVFQNWTRSGYQVTVLPTYTYTMPAANTTLQANFAVLTCSASYTIQCETDYLPTFTLPQDIEFHTDGDGTGTDLHYGSYHGTGYAAYKNHGGDLYYMLDIPQAGEYSITVYLTDGSNRWLNVFSTATTSHQNITYGGVTYYKIAADGDNMGNGSDQPFQTFSVTKTLAAGKHIIGVWAEDCYAAFDQIVVTRTDNSQVFCEQIQDLYLIGNIYGTNYLWNPNPGNHEGRMTRQSDGTYTIRTRIASSISAPYSGGTFAFTTVEGTWDEVNAHRFGPSETTVATSYGNNYAYSEQNNSNNWSVPVAGTYTITLNPKTHSFRIDGPELYFNGQSGATNYSESNYQLMEYNQTNNVYTLVTRIANSAAGTGNGTASFTVDIAGDATYINNNRYGPASANATPAAEGATNTIALNGANKFSAAAGWYYIEVDLESSPKTARFYPTCEPRAMDIWTGSVPVSENYTGVDELGETVTLSADDQNWWLRQVVLGPEHFQTAHVGDTLRVFYTSITTDPKGGLHKTNNYDPLSTDGTAYHVSDNSEVTISDGETYVLKSFYLPTNGYYHIITASSLAELKTRGVVVKGKGHTITKIALHPVCDEDERRVNADLTNVATSVDLRDDPYLIGDVNAGGFNLGEWEHQLAFPRQNFTHVAVGDYVNVYVSITDVDATISFRCNVESIIADDKQGGEGCPSYGDVSFDRTIDNLDGDAPVVIGDNNYSVITMEVTEDMKRRLDQTGFIIAGKGALVYRVESVTRLFVIGSESTIEEKRVPTVVHDLVIWQGSQASNTDDIDVRGSITYVRPSVGGMHTQTGTTGVVGNTIDQWYTFALPFEVSAIKVYDKTDHAYYDGIQSIYRTDANDSGQSRAGGNNPLGRGFFYFNWLKAENLTGVLEVFRARWEYVDSETSESKTAELNGTRYGYPIKLYPYIIMFTDWGGTDTYFSDNNEVRFVGGPQLVRGTSDAIIITEDGEYFYYYPNNTLHSMTITGSAYKLNETNNRFYLEDNPVIPPFECYIQATSRYKALHRSISFTNFVSDDEPDVPTQIDQDSMETLYEWIAQNAEVRVLDPTGKLVKTLQLGTGELQQLPKGVYMLQNGKTTVKVIL